MNVASRMDQLDISADSPISLDSAVGLETGDQQVRVSLRFYNVTDDLLQ